jgi:hypothetical protein
MPTALRVSVPQAGLRWPRYCACCLLALDAPGQPGADGLEVPWCDDCRRHSGMRRVEGGVRWARRGSWAVAALGLALWFTPIRPRWYFLGLSGTFFFLALGLAAMARLKLEDRKESCAAAGPPVRLVGRTAQALELECDNADFAGLLAEANPGARTNRG